MGAMALVTCEAARGEMQSRTLRGGGGVTALEAFGDIRDCFY
jgi:hypothetical protein